MNTESKKLNNKSAVRNRDEILEVLPRFLPNHGTILEIAAGSGEHCIHFAPHFPNAIWQPSDRSDTALASIAEYVAESGIKNLQAPIKLDVQSQQWPIQSASAMLCINMIHASEWPSTIGLLHGAARTLTSGAPLLLYGAYFRKDRETTPSNLEFDRKLREKDETWGIRQFEIVKEEAERAGLIFDQILDVPNNNCVVVFRKP